MHIFLASDPLAMWGQIAAIIMLIYLLVFIVISLGIALVLLMGMTWVREKIELIKRIRPVVDSVNMTTQAAVDGTLAPPTEAENKIVRTAVEIPAYTRTVEKKVEQGSDLVAGTVIEFRARTMMAKGVLTAFFSPALTQRQKPQLQTEGVGFRSPDYRIVVEDNTPVDTSTESPSTGPNNAPTP